ncbi:MAG: tRNA dimethylallyltransferase, partial [Pseudomonadota bacterium]|nr:tRNA dimethylallyltransferase [Pseudomonadota bacterium]
QAWEAADGLIPHSELRDRGIFATRQLAKRQITWLSNTLECERFDCLAPDLFSQLAEQVGTLFC